jgi:hypothetical protein
VNFSQVDCRFERAGVRDGRRFEQVTSFICSTASKLRVTEPGEELGMFADKRKRALEMLGRLDPMLSLGKHRSEHCVRVRIVGVALKRGTSYFLSLLRAPQLQQQACQVGVRPATLRSDRDCSSQRRFGSLVIACKRLDFERIEIV